MLDDPKVSHDRSDSASETRESPEEESREHALDGLQQWLERPMLVLSLVWLVLLAVELVWGVNRGLWFIAQAIWVIFIIEFALGFTLAPRKPAFLRANWLKALSLLAPALRILRIARFVRAGAAARGLRLVRVVGSMNRGMGALGTAMRRRGFGYVLALTVMVVLLGAAGMYALEREAQGGGFPSYAAALWWTAMLITTMGSEYWPKTPDGRLLCLFLSIYAFTVFGYVTATLATFFIGRDAQEARPSVSPPELDGLRRDIDALRTEVRGMARER